MTSAESRAGTLRSPLQGHTPLTLGQPGRAEGCLHSVRALQAHQDGEEALNSMGTPQPH